MMMKGYYDSEYHRRNLQVARVVGAKAAVDQALARARTLKRSPKWMIQYLESAAERLPGVSTDLASYRDASPDYAEYGPAAAAAWVEENNRRIVAALSRAEQP